MLDLTRAPVDLSEHGVGGRRVSGEVDTYMYTERGIYRPGETVELTALLRDRSGRAVTGRAGQIKVLRPNGLVAASFRFNNPDSSAVLYRFELPKGASRGEWTARTEIDGIAASVGSVSFSVEDFIPQRIAVDLQADEATPILAGGSREIEVSSRFLYGAPGAGLTVQSDARLEADQNPFPAFEGLSLWTP